MIDTRQVTGWFDAHAAALVLYARQWLRDPSQAEDVVHDVFVRLIAQPRAPEDPAAWLFRAVRNAAISASRSVFRRRRREARVGGWQREWFEHRVDDLIDANDAQIALELLDTTAREIVVLRLWAGLGFQQIAELTGCSVSTAFERYRQALRAMRQQLETGRCRSTNTTNNSTST